MKPLAILILSTALLTPAAVSAKECLNTPYAGSNVPFFTGRYEDMAKDNAVISWGARVLLNVGAVFSNWENAEDKTFSCSKQGRLYACTATARPCTK